MSLRPGQVSPSYDAILVPMDGAKSPPVITINGKRFLVHILKNGRREADVGIDPRQIEGINRAYNKIFKELNQNAQDCFMKAASRGEVVIVSHNADDSVRAISTHKLDVYQTGKLRDDATTEVIPVQKLFKAHAEQNTKTLAAIGQALRGEDYVPETPRGTHFEERPGFMEPLPSRRSSERQRPIDQPLGLHDEEFDEEDTRELSPRGQEVFENAMFALDAIRNGEDPSEVMSQLREKDPDAVTTLLEAMSGFGTSSLAVLAEDEETAAYLIRDEVLNKEGFLIGQDSMIPPSPKEQARALAEATIRKIIATPDQEDDILDEIDLEDPIHQAAHRAVMTAKPDAGWEDYEFGEDDELAEDTQFHLSQFLDHYDFPEVEAAPVDELEEIDRPMLPLKQQLFSYIEGAIESNGFTWKSISIDPRELENIALSQNRRIFVLGQGDKVDVYGPKELMSQPVGPSDAILRYTRKGGLEELQAPAPQRRDVDAVPSSVRSFLPTAMHQATRRQPDDQEEEFDLDEEQLLPSDLWTSDVGARERPVSLLQRTSREEMERALLQDEELHFEPDELRHPRPVVRQTPTATSQLPPPKVSRTKAKHPQRVVDSTDPRRVDRTLGNPSSIRDEEL